MAKPSLKYQINSVINKCFTPGRSKRSDKFSHGYEWRIYSYSTKDSLHDTGKRFADFCKSRGIKWLKDITYIDVQAFLDAQAYTHNDLSLKKIYSHLKHLEIATQHVFCGSKINWGIEQNVVPPVSKQKDGYTKNIVMPIDVIDKVIISMQGGMSQAWKSLILSESVGLRVNETINLQAKNIILDNSQDGFGHVKIVKGGGAKGNRPRIVPIPTAQAKKQLQDLIKDIDSDEYVVKNSLNGQKMTPKAVTVAFGRALKKLGLYDKYKGNLNHSLRKTFATNYYNNYRKKHTRKETVARVNEILGHGKQRSEAELRHYVHNIW